MYTDNFLDKLRSMPTDKDGWIRNVNISAIAREANPGKDWGKQAASGMLRRLRDMGIVEIDKTTPNSTKIQGVRFRDYSTKERVLNALWHLADNRGRVKASTHSIALWLGLNDHDLTKMLFDLRKVNAVEFRKTGSDNAMRLSAIKVLERPSERAMREAAELRANAEKPAEPQPEPEATNKLDGYPLISQLIGRRQNIEKAVAHLEAAGLEVDAIALMEKTDDLSPIEKEIIRFVENC